MLRLKRPANKSGEPATSVLLISNSLQMFDPLLHRLDMAEHHRRARFQSQLVRDLHHFEPLLAVNFQRRNFFPDAIDQNFATTAVNRSQPRLLKSENHFPQRHPESFREMLKLRRTEPVNVDLRIFFPDVLQKIDIPLESEFRMV